MFNRLFASVVRNTSLRTHTRWLNFPPHRFIVQRHPTRHVSNIQTHPRAQTRTTEIVTLPVGGNRHVDLEIFHPLTDTTTVSPKSSTGTSANDILVHLHPGPSSRSIISSRSIVDGIHGLANHFPNLTLIDIRYRLTPRDVNTHVDTVHSERDDRFPTPIHDVFTAWDYVIDPESPHNKIKQENKGKSVSSDTGENNSSKVVQKVTQRRICVYGSHIGGSLALALALANPHHVTAVAVEEPMIDWVGLDGLMTFEGSATVRAVLNTSTASKRSRNVKTKARQQEEHEIVAAAARELINLRTRLFRTPSGYFDAFASPVLFLRAPGRDTPTTASAMPEETVLSATHEMEVKSQGQDVKSQGYGPYDDDWQIVDTDQQMQKGDDGDSVSSYETAMEQPVTDLSYWKFDGGDSELVASPRRRKVLRRWPPVTLSEEPLLPYVDVFLRKPGTGISSTENDEHKVDVAPIVYAQGMEAVELMRRACFWGREKGLAGQTVKVVEVDGSDADDYEKKAIEWLRTRFAGDE